MTRRFVDDVRSDIVTLFPDNIIGDISPADLRSVTTDMCDSLIQDEAGITSNAATLGVVTAPSYAAITDAYDADLGGDGSFLIPDFTTGTLATSTTAGFTYVINANVSFNDLSNSAEINFTIFRNGAPLGIAARATGEGAGDPQSVSLRAIVLSAGVSDVYAVAMQTPAGANTVDITDIEMLVSIQPTNNP